MNEVGPDLRAGMTCNEWRLVILPPKRIVKNWFKKETHSNSDQLTVTQDRWPGPRSVLLTEAWRWADQTIASVAGERDLSAESEVRALPSTVLWRTRVAAIHNCRTEDKAGEAARQERKSVLERSGLKLWSGGRESNKTEEKDWFVIVQGSAWDTGLHRLQLFVPSMRA